MDIKKVTEDFSVSGQLAPEDITALHEAGIKTLICNRPDQEAAGQPAYADLAAQARAHGMAIHLLPVVHSTINSNDVNTFASLLDTAEKPIHAWCGSGLRAITLWSLAQRKSAADNANLIMQAQGLGFDFKSFTSRFAPVIAEQTDAFRDYPVAQHCAVLIIGGGAGGISLASSLLHRDPALQITIVEPAEKHYYQPGFTLVGAGIFSLAQTERTTAELMPGNVNWIKAAATNFLPDLAQVVLSNGTRLSYDRLCVCAGLKLNWSAVAGLQETLGKNGVTSNYSPQLAPYTWRLVQELKAGKAIFTQPPMPIKCAGAPQKVMYLSADHWRRTNCLPQMQVDFYNAGGVLFGVKDYVPALMSYVEKYHVNLHFQHNLVKVDGPRRVATFATTDKEGKTALQETGFDMLHVSPPQCAPDFINNSPLADRAGWVDVDQATLRHKKYSNIWGLGDVTNTPNAKTAAAVRKQVPVAASNILHNMRNETVQAAYDGYGSCPLTVAKGRIVLAEFLYGGKLSPTFPDWLIKGTKPTWQAWMLKKYLLPWVYWHLMLKGREMLTASATKP